MVLPALGLPHHYGYLVDDLERAAADWYRTTGIGPFLVVPHVSFDELTVRGIASTLDHTAAFAAWGPQFVELQVVHDISDHARGTYGAGGEAAALHHIAFVVANPEEISDRLTAAGAPRTVTASGSGLDVTLHDTSRTNGARLEIHRDTDFLRTFFAGVRSAAEHWDGRQLTTELNL